MSEAVAYNPAVVAEKRTRIRLWILAIILFLSTVAYADRSILSISGSGIKDEFGLSPVQLGFILSAFSWAYVLGQIPGGLILDRFGTKTVYGVTLVLWSVSTFLMGLVGKFTTEVTTAVTLFFGLRFALGLIEGPSFPANARVAVMWFPKSERGRATSLFASASYFAVGIFSPLSGWLVSQFGWPWPSLCSARSAWWPRSSGRITCTSRATTRLYRGPSSTTSSRVERWSISTRPMSARKSVDYDAKRNGFKQCGFACLFQALC